VTILLPVTVLLSVCFFSMGGISSAKSEPYIISRTETRFFCHRGYANRYPENSMIAEKKAMEAGMYGLNCDLWPTKKDSNGNIDFAVTHDENLIRMTDSDVNVRDLTAGEVVKYRITKGVNADKYKNQYILLLRDILELGNSYAVPIQMELKGSWTGEQLEALAGQLVEYGYDNRAIIESMSVDNLVEFSKSAQQAGLNIMTNLVSTSKDNNAMEHAKLCKDNGITAIVAHYKCINSELVSWCKKNGVLCAAYVDLGKSSNPIVHELLKYDLYSIGTPDIPWYGTPDDINLPSVFNIRELGGYVTEDGKTVKRGCLYRGGETAYMSDNDARILTEDYGLTDIVDLRYRADVRECSDRIPEGVEYKHIPMRTEKESAAASAKNRYKLFSEKLGIGTADFRSAILDRSTIVSDDYTARLFLDEYSRKQMKKLFKYILKKDDAGAVYFHGIYGKDRTGVCSAVILLALGVPEETVVRDYEYPNTVAEFFGLLSGADVKLVNKESFKKAIKKVKDKYGTYYRYFTDGIGLSDKQLKKLKNKYLD
ncbi:MAG: tyrosine-protein phosphatase, partial [Eubacterium sp.]|nr:tyrosine-protein phosphatase [Eubacterium sp.]